uniref:BED-type domain-containing protein n=1 Tax=Meloidogyne incognita TaxID=6306 RepID=A0A914KKL0_MELIC
MGKTSDIWKYFSKSNSENSAKCLICDKNLACNKGSTKGLWDHFKSMHEKEYCTIYEPGRSCFGHQLSGKMVQKILIIKGNLNKVELAPLIDNEEEDVEEIDSDDE